MNKYTEANTAEQSGNGAATLIESFFVNVSMALRRVNNAHIISPAVQIGWGWGQEGGEGGVCGDVRAPSG